MKAILEYNLPEEREEFEYATKGILYSIALTDLDNYLRGKLKYESLSDAEYKIYEEVREKLNEFVRDRGVEI